MRALMVFAVLVMTNLAHARVDVEPPAGWFELVEQGAAQRAQLMAQPGTRDATARMWKADTGIGGLQTMEIITPLRELSPQSKMFAMEQRSLALLPTTWKQTALKHNFDKQRAVVEQTFDVDGSTRVQLRRYYVADRARELHAVVVTCIEPSAGTACAPALASVRLDIADAVDFEPVGMPQTLPGGGLPQLAIVGAICLVAIVLLVVLMRRQPRRRPRRGVVADR